MAVDLRPPLGRVRRQKVAVEVRRQQGWSKREMRAFYDRLVHHDRLRNGRAVVDAIGRWAR